MTEVKCSACGGMYPQEVMVQAVCPPGQVCEMCVRYYYFMCSECSRLFHEKYYR
jgi:hypothetical protein